MTRWMEARRKERRREDEAEDQKVSKGMRRAEE
jgi:hypothetical protein